MKHLNIINAVGLLLIVGLTAFRVASLRDGASPRELTDQQMAKINGGECTQYDRDMIEFYDEKCNRYNEIDACEKARQLRLKCLAIPVDPNAPIITPNPGPPPPPCDPCPNGGSEEEYSTCQQIGGQILGTSACWNGTGPTRVCCN